MFKINLIISLTCKSWTLYPFEVSLILSQSWILCYISFTHLTSTLLFNWRQLLIFRLLFILNMHKSLKKTHILFINHSADVVALFLHLKSYGLYKIFLGSLLLLPLGWFHRWIWMTRVFSFFNICHLTNACTYDLWILLLFVILFYCTH